MIILTVEETVVVKCKWKNMEVRRCSDGEAE